MVDTAVAATGDHDHGVGRPSLKRKAIRVVSDGSSVTTIVEVVRLEGAVFNYVVIVRLAAERALGTTREGLAREQGHDYDGGARKLHVGWA